MKGGSLAHVDRLIALAPVTEVDHRVVGEGLVEYR
jgi:hypothetical protein